MTELKPCPFCGDEAIIFEAINGKTIGYYVGCRRRGAIYDEPKCHVEPMVSRWGKNAKERAIEAWNNRPSPWHTGTPTEDGTFLVLWKDSEEQMRRFSVLHWNEYNDTWYDEESTCCNWGDEYHAEVIAWQKIEPYKEKA